MRVHMMPPEARKCWRLHAGHVLLLLAGIGTTAGSQALDIRPSVQAGAVYTSNLTLTPENEIDDIVMRISPRVDLEHNSERIDFRANYTYSYLSYSETDDNDSSYTYGSADLNLSLIKDTFFLESLVEQSQQVTDPEAGIWYTNVPIVDNRTDETRLETSPHLNTEIFGLELDTRYIVGTVAYDSPELNDVDYQETHTALTGRERGKGLSWGLFHDYEVYEYSLPPDDKSQSAYLTLTYGFREAGDAFIFGTIGLENDYDDFTSGSLEETFWEVGLRRVTGRTLIEASVGDHSYGSTFGARIRQELNEGSFELAYSEDPSVDEQIYDRQARTATDPQPGVPQSIDRPGVGDRFIYKLASATLVKEFGRNQLEVVAFHEKRDDIIDRDQTPSPETQQDSETQTGGGIGLTRELGRRTTVGLEGEFAKREFQSGNDDQVSAIRALATYALGRQLDLEGFVARYEQRESEIATDNYDEIQVGLFANYSFR